MLYNEIPTTFPWYDDKLKQNREIESVEKSCDYKLISPIDSILPFEFTKVVGMAAPTEWEIREINTDALIADLSGDIDKIHVRLLDGQEYWYFDGQSLGLSLPKGGFYYSKITFPDSTVVWSEMFYVPEESFLKADDNATKYLKIEYYNDSDIAPIYYGDEQTDGKPYFKNIVYLDTVITSSEPTVTQEGTNDGNDDLIPTFSKVNIPYRISAFVPDFLRKALTTAQLHDHVIITTPGGVRSGEVKNIAVASTTEANGAAATVEILFQEIVITKSGCGDNLVSDCEGEPASFTSIIISEGNYVIVGTAPAGTTVNIYKGTYLAMDRNLITTVSAATFASGVSIPVATMDDADYFVCQAVSFGCDFGFSAPRTKPV